MLVGDVAFRAMVRGSGKQMDSKGECQSNEQGAYSLNASSVEMLCKCFYVGSYSAGKDMMR